MLEMRQFFLKFESQSNKHKKRETPLGKYTIMNVADKSHESML